MTAHNPSIVAFDFDGTLAITPTLNDTPKPNPKMIERLKEHYEAYDFIVIYTARPEEDRPLLVSRLQAWGVPYDAIVMNKLRFTLLYDDKAVGRCAETSLFP